MTVFKAPSHYNQDDNLSLVVTNNEEYATLNVKDDLYKNNLSLNLTKDQIKELATLLNQLV